MIADENSIIFYLAKRCEFPPQAGCPALTRQGKAGTSDAQQPTPFWVPVIAAKPRIAAKPPLSHTLKIHTSDRTRQPHCAEDAEYGHPPLFTLFFRVPCFDPPGQSRNRPHPNTNTLPGARNRGEAAHCGQDAHISTTQTHAHKSRTAPKTASTGTPSSLFSSGCPAHAQLEQVLRITNTCINHLPNAAYACHPLPQSLPFALCPLPFAYRRSATGGLPLSPKPLSPHRL